MANLYFVLEGEKNEPAFYEAWVKYLNPHFEKVSDERAAIDNHFYILKGSGIPSIYEDLCNAIDDLNGTYLQYTHLFVCCDAEELTVQQRIAEFEEELMNAKIKLRPDCELHYVIQNPCIETWFLGNRIIVRPNPQNAELVKFLNYYNVKQNCPELMPAYLAGGYKWKAQFHLEYLKAVLKERNINYSKNNPKPVLANYYFDEMKKRILSPEGHLQSLRSIYDRLIGL